MLKKNVFTLFLNRRKYPLFSFMTNTLHTLALVPLAFKTI